MTVKVTIKKNSAAAKVFKKFMAEKKAFRNAVETGKSVDYSKNKAAKFATPV